MCIEYTIHVSVHSCDCSISSSAAAEPHRCEEAGVSKESLYGACCGWVVLHEIGIAPSFFRSPRIVLLLIHVWSRSPQDRVVVSDTRHCTGTASGHSRLSEYGCEGFRGYHLWGFQAGADRLFDETALFDSVGVSAVFVVRSPFVSVLASLRHAIVANQHRASLRITLLTTIVLITMLEK